MSVMTWVQLSCGCNSRVRSKMAVGPMFIPTIRPAALVANSLVPDVEVAGNRNSTKHNSLANAELKVTMSKSTSWHQSKALFPFATRGFSRDMSKGLHKIKHWVKTFRHNKRRSSAIFVVRF